MKEIRIGNTVEQCVERADYPPERIKPILANETVAVLGYGVQGRGQSLNMKDNGVNVIIGLREGPRAGSRPRKTAGCPARPSSRWKRRPSAAPIIQYLLSDAGQKDYWPTLKPNADQGQGPVLLARLLDRLQATRPASSRRRTST